MATRRSLKTTKLPGRMWCGPVGHWPGSNFPRTPRAGVFRKAIERGFRMAYEICVYPDQRTAIIVKSSDLRAPPVNVFKSSRQALIIAPGDDARVALISFAKRSTPY